MAQYNVSLARTLSTSASVGVINAPASGMRRAELLQIILGVEGTPGDTALKLVVQRFTAAGTNTAVTPQPRDPADAAAVTVCGQNSTVEPTYTSNAVLMSESQNQRSTVRWIENPGSGIMIPATASNGLGFATPTAPALAGTLQAMFIEQ